ncbi:hypothetical protein AB1Y20_015372 [Prymnesium parvum]|uniref:Major facilitator superfamily associated domain-containing protein n=1 Tax=Prymnesium parvum TaxID=97485 RepID=A0AB34JWY5_PRYPA
MAGEEAISELEEAAPSSMSSSRKPDASRNRLLCLMKVLFFLQSWSPSGMLRTGSLYLLDRGMTVAQIGQIEAAGLFLPALTSPLWGLLADRLRRRKAVSLGLMVISIALLALLAMPQIGCMHCFWRLMALMTALSVFNLGGTVDAYTLDFLGEAHKGEYGVYRLWGSVGWATSAISAGIVAEHAGFVYNFPVYGAAAVAMLLLCAFLLPARTASEHSPMEGREMELYVLMRGLRHWRVLVALAEVLILGVGVGVAEKLIFAYVVRELGGSPSLCGYGVACMSLTNVPLFFFSNRLLRYMGRDWMFALAVAAYTLRAIAYTLLTRHTVYLFLPIEFLHGVTYSLSRAATVDFIQAALPAAWLTTGQQILLVTGQQGIGGGLGALAGGWYMSQHGGKQTYTLAAVASSVLLGFHVVSCSVLWLCRRSTLLSLPHERRQRSFPAFSTAQAAEPLVSDSNCHHGSVQTSTEAYVAEGADTGQHEQRVGRTS